MKTTRFLVLAVAAALASFVSVPHSLASTTLRVPSNYPTIQAAIDASANGDTVVVSPGIYRESINFQGKLIVVESASGPESTVIQGNYPGGAVRFDSRETRAATLLGFTISNGTGVVAINASPTITGNVITHNRSCYAPGVYASNGSPLINRNVISDNQAGYLCSGGSAGGIALQGTSAAEVTGNAIENNTVTSGNAGGMEVFASSAAVISGNTIAHNRASGLSPGSEGGGIWIANSTNIVIIQNLIIDNSADDGGGIAILAGTGQAGPAIVNNTIAGNSAVKGSGIFMSGFLNPVLVENNIVTAPGSQQGIYCQAYSSTIAAVRFNDVFASGSPAYGGNCGDIDHNISVDPLFAKNPHAEFRLLPASALIDAGDNSAPDLPPTDLAGNPRIADGNHDGVATIDMGVYEYCPASMSGGSKALPGPQCAILRETP